MSRYWRGALFNCALVSASSLAAQTPTRLAPDAGHAYPGVRDGDIRAFTLTSAILGEMRRVYLSLPASFARSAPARRYPVIVVLDGESLVQPIVAASTQLTSMGQAPEAIIVGIENTARIRDLTPPGLEVSGSTTHEGGDRFLDFIERELLPAVDRQFRGGEPRTLVGHSSGGILATYAAATRNGFRAVIAIDTPVNLGDEWLAKKLMARTAATGSPLRYVSYEAKFGWPDASWQALEKAAPASWLLHREKLARESHESMTLLGSYLGVREVFRDYSMLAAPVSPTLSILGHYDSVSKALGATVAPPRKLLMQVVEDLIAEGHGAAARAAFTSLVTAYGAPASVSSLEARIAQAERRPAPTETVESLLAMPFPTPDQVRPFVGEWIGDTWIGPDDPHAGRQTLRIRIANDRVVAELVRHPSPGVDMVEPLTYLRMTGNGLTYGFLNQIRPRAVNLFEGTVKGDTLSGKHRFGGFDTASEEDAGPQRFFRFVRVTK